MCPGKLKRNVANLARKVTALSGFEIVVKIPLPPLIGLIKVADFHFLGIWVLCKPVPKCKMAIEAHEFAKIDVGNTQIASNDQHILVVIRGRSFAEIRRTGNYQGI